MNDKIAYELEPFNAILIWPNDSSRYDTKNGCVAD